MFRGSEAFSKLSRAIANGVAQYSAKNADNDSEERRRKKREKTMRKGTYRREKRSDDAVCRKPTIALESPGDGLQSDREGTLELTRSIFW